MTRSIWQLISRRSMCRSYEARTVPRHLILRVVEAARRVPSAGHAQGIRFAVTTDPAKREQIAVAFGEENYLGRGYQPWLSRAPVHVIAAVREQSYLERYAEPDKTVGPGEWDIPYPIMDGGQALMALYLAAEECGLSCGYLGPHAGPDLVKMLGLPQDWRFFGLVTLGYRKGPTAKTRSQKRGWRDFDEVVRWI